MEQKCYNNYMQRALELAMRGWGNTSPNPMVGAVLLNDGVVVGEGHHKGPGLDHAEVAAIKNAGDKAKGATLVVNLEPCCHLGKTPPCTDAIIEAGIKHVVYGVRDPNPNVDGKGITKLKRAGIKVEGPVLENECKSLNRIYVHWIKTGRPYVISKVAISLDGKIATRNGNSKWITGEKCRARMHYWRGGVDAILVGAETVRKDDPLLNARGVGDVKQPRPVVITASGNVDVERNVWDRDRAPIIICNKSSNVDHLRDKGVDIVEVEVEVEAKVEAKVKVKVEGRGSRLDWESILKELGKREITSVLVEGGGQVHSQLIEKRLADYMVASLSPKLIGSDGLDWLPGLNLNSVSDSPRLNPDQILILDDNVVIEGEVVY